MTRMVALVRGVNVGGRSKVAMGDLRRIFEDLGHTDVRTYLQSGNVVFAPEGRAKRDALGAAVEKRMKQEFANGFRVILRDPDELARLVAGNPYGEQDDPTKVNVTFLAERPDRARLTALEAPAGADEFTAAGSDIYLHTPGGYGRTKLNNAFFERKLGVAATTRNWRTVTRLAEMLAE